jgi:Rap1a immunity proteins
MRRTHIVLMSLSLASAMIPYPGRAQASTPTVGSGKKTDGAPQTESQSGKSQLKNKKGAAAESPQHPNDITGSGKVFLDGCSSIDKPAKQLSSYETHSNVQCLSYVDGIFETMSLVDNLHLKPQLFCAPEQPVQRKELVQIVRKYVVDHPETSDERTVALAWLAFTQAFPCNKAKAEGKQTNNDGGESVCSSRSSFDKGVIRD